jgi:Xaa-Pro dipeptidase
MEIKTAILDREKFNRLDSLMESGGMDALLCHHPENIIYVSGHFPVHGVSLALYLPGGKTRLLVPECEKDLVDTRPEGVSTFPWGHLHDPDFTENHRLWVKTVIKESGFEHSRVGIELSTRTTAPAYRTSETLNVPDWAAYLKSCSETTTFTDATDILEKSRSIKTVHEIAQMRRACEIAEMGISAFMWEIKSGMTELEAASLIESAIRTNGPGYEGARLVRGYCELTSGSRGTFQQSMLTPAGNREFQSGDLVMLELGTVVDGYWSDLTYTVVVGEANGDQRRIYNTVLKAQQSAIEQLIPGNKWRRADQAAREIIQEAGLGEYFTHGTGHGIGLRYHESIPILSPGLDALFEAGMVTSVEPGVYIPGIGGFRIEDDVVITEDGPLYLSTPRTPW